MGQDHRINKRGLRLTRNWHRYRIILNRPQDDLDYKDITAFTGPENVRGLSISDLDLSQLLGRTRMYGSGCPA